MHGRKTSFWHSLTSWISTWVGDKYQECWPILIACGKQFLMHSNAYSWPLYINVIQLYVTCCFELHVQSKSCGNRKEKEHISDVSPTRWNVIYFIIPSMLNTFQYTVHCEIVSEKKQTEGKHINKDMREGIIANGSCNESPTNEIKFFKTAIRKSSKRLFAF